MAAITWQNINGPSLAEATRPMEAASRSFTGAFDGLANVLKQREATQTANWDQAKVNNTNALLGAVQEPKTPEEFAAKEAQLRQQLLGYGAQVDPVAARAALDGRMATLQQRAVAGMDFTNKVQANTLAPIQEEYKIAALRGDKAGMAAAEAKLGNQVGTASALDYGYGINQRNVTEKRAVEDHVNKKLDLDSNIAHRAEQDSIARDKLQIDRDNVQEQRNARIAASSDAGIRAKANLLNQAGELVKNQTSAVQEVKKNTPYAEMFGGSSIDIISKAATDINDGNPKYGNAVVSKITELRKTYPDIPVDVIKSALSMAKNEFGSSLWLSDGYSNSVVDHIKTQMKDPEVVNRIAFANEQMAKAQGQYKGSSLDLPKPAAADVPVRDLPPQLKFSPPKQSQTGSLTYEKPGSFSISGNQGIAVPTQMPEGKMDVSVTDGDTIAVKGANGVGLKFRFNGIDAQETAKTRNGKTSPGQKFGAEAQAFVTDAFKQGRVDVRIASNQPDDKGRLIADIYVDGKNLNEALLRKGLATVLAVKGGIGPSQQAHFNDLQNGAMRNNFGIMGDLNSDRSPTGSSFRMFEDNLYN